MVISFIDIVVSLAKEKGMGIIGMKIYFRGLAAKVPGLESMEQYFRFVLSRPLSTVVIGCDNTRQLEENVHFEKDSNDTLGY